MSDRNIGDWLQTGVSLSVLAGVLLVGWEIRQNNTLAAYERVNEINQMWLDISEFQADHNVQMIHKKAIESPQLLTDSEILLMDDWLNMVMIAIAMNELQNRVHGLQTAPAMMAGEYADDYFSSEFTRRWLQQNWDWYAPDAPEFFALLETHIAETPPTSRFTYLEEMRFGSEDMQ